MSSGLLLPASFPVFSAFLPLVLYVTYSELFVILFCHCMSVKLSNYLRAHRKRAGFSQAEIAFLLGCQSSAKVSRYERFSRKPNLETVFVYELVFQVPARELFAGLFSDIEMATIQRAQKLMQKLNTKNPDPITASRLEVLKAIAARSLGESQSP
jgi:transcriptional regulator with XRE-family HTH domain